MSNEDKLMQFIEALDASDRYPGPMGDTNGTNPFCYETFPHSRSDAEDWRNYVPVFMIPMWPELYEESKLAIDLTAINASLYRSAHV